MILPATSLHLVWGFVSIVCSWRKVNHWSWTLRCCYILTWHMRSLERVTSDGGIHLCIFIYLFIYFCLFIYEYIYIYILYICIYMCMWLYVQYMHTHKHTYRHACMQRHANTLCFTHIRIYIYIYKQLVWPKKNKLERLWRAFAHHAGEAQSCTWSQDGC